MNSTVTLDTLASRPAAPQDCPALGGRCCILHNRPNWVGDLQLDHHSDEHSLPAAAGFGFALGACLFQGDEPDSQPFVSLWAESTDDAELNAEQARAYAVKLRALAAGIDQLAAQLDAIKAGA